MLTARKGDGLASAPDRRLTALVAALLVLLPALYLVKIWLDPGEAWLHPELYGSSEYIWSTPNEPVLAKLRKALDWKAFDPNVNRVRPLSDASDTIDTIARPHLAAVFGPQASISPVAIVTAVLSPLLLFLALRTMGLGLVPAAALTAVFLSSTGFLSVLIAYIRPAKKITMLTFCVALYLCARHDQTRSRGLFLGFVTVLLLSFFADEMDLVKYPVFALLYPISLLRDARWWKRAVFLSLPVLFLVITIWGLPFVYERFSVHGTWNAFGDSKKIEVLAQLLKPYFYVAWLVHTATAVLTTVGIALQTPLTIGGVLLLLIVIPGVVVLRRLAPPAAQYRLVASTLALFLAGFYATLLDWYPFPDEISYLGVFTYYYHSALVVVVVLWLASVWLAVEPLLRTMPRRIRTLQVVALATTVVVIANFTLFHRVNLLVQYIHTIPYASEAMFARLRALAPQLSTSDGSTELVVVDFERQRDQMSNKYDETLRSLFGSAWQSTTFYSLFQSIKQTPIMRDENLAHLVRAFYPRATFVVQVYNGPRRVVPLDAQAPAVAEAVYDAATRERLMSDLRDGLLILDTRTGALTRDHQGEYVDVFTGVEGQRITVRNVGAWDAATRQLAGAPAEFRAGSWHLLASPDRVLTAPFDVASGQPQGLPAGFALSPGAAGVTVARLRDEDGPFVRFTAEVPFADLLVVATGPLPAPVGAPLTIRTQIRYRGAAGAQVHLQQTSGGSAPAVATARATQPDRWLTLVAIVLTSLQPAPDDLFFAGVLGVQPGGSFDMRDLSVSAGVFP